MFSVNHKSVDELWMETGAILDRFENLMRVVHKTDTHLAKLIELKDWQRNRQPCSLTVRPEAAQNRKKETISYKGDQQSS